MWRRSRHRSIPRFNARARPLILSVRYPKRDCRNHNFALEMCDVRKICRYISLDCSLPICRMTGVHEDIENTIKACFFSDLLTTWQCRTCSIRLWNGNARGPLALQSAYCRKRKSDFSELIMGSTKTTSSPHERSRPSRQQQQYFYSSTH